MSYRLINALDRKMKLHRKPNTAVFFLFLLPLLVGCSTTPVVPDEQSSAIESTSESINELIAAARSRSGLQAAPFSIRAMEEMLVADLVARAAAEASLLNRPDNLSAVLQLRYALVRGEIALRQQQPEIALRWLTGSLVDQLQDLPEYTNAYYLLLGNAYLDLQQFSEAAVAYMALGTATQEPEPGELNVHDGIWNALSKLDDDELNQMASNADSYELRGWIELARVLRVDQFSIKSQLDSIAQWRRIWSRHSAATLLPQALLDLEQVWEQRPKHIALILPLQLAAGSAIQEGFLSAYYQALSISRDVPRISVYDSSGLSAVYAVYDDAIASGADLVIGPLDKELVNQLRRLPELSVPTLALNYADEVQPDAGRLYQFGLAPEDEIEQAVQLAWQAGHRNAAIVTPATDDYIRHQTTFSEKWSALGGDLVSQATFSGDSDYADVIKRLMAIDSSEARADRLLDLLPRSNMEFIPRRRDDIDFIFLIANPRQGRQIKPTLAFYFAENVPVYAMPSIYDGVENPSANRDLDGIVFTDAPWILNSTDPLKIDMSSNLRPAQGAVQRFRAMGIDSFRLYPRLQQLANRQIPSMAGTTGILTMAEDQIIHRDLGVAKFVEGLATLVETRVAEPDNSL